MGKKKKAKIKWITIWAVGALLVSIASSILINDISACFIIGLFYGVLAGDVCISCYTKEAGYDD